MVNLLTEAEQLEYDQLKNRGWRSLKEERPRYSELKSKSGEEESMKPSAALTMTQEQLEALIDSKIATLKAENANLKARVGKEMDQGTWKEVKAPIKRNKTVHFKLYRPDGDTQLGLVKDWRWLKDMKDENGKMYPLYEITCLYGDNTETKFQIPLMDFIKVADLEKCEVIEEDRKKLVKVHGKVRIAPQTKDGYTISAMAGYDVPQGGDYVDLEETKDEVFVTIKRDNGQTFRVNVNRCNA